MKNLIIILVLFGLLASCTNQPKETFNFSINGTIDGDYSGQAYLFKRESGEWVELDTALVENGSFLFKGNIDLPEIYYISLEGENQYSSIFVEDSEISFQANVSDFRNSIISGSATQAEYEVYLAKTEEYDVRLEETWNLIKKADEAGNEKEKEKFDEEFDKLESEQNRYIIDYAMGNNSSVVAAYIVYRNAYNFDETDLEPVVKNFDPSINKSVYVKTLTERVETLKKVAVGQPAIDFTMTDIEGNELALSSLYGSYLLVDFWASWCGPCRRENPNVVNAYNEFKDKGFDILGVSFDKDRGKWIEAVRVDDLTWRHVSDLEGWGNAAGKLYGINSIPANILLDAEGTIIAKDLRGKDLHSKLAELLN